MLSKYTIFFVFLLSTHLNVQSQNTANKHRLRTVVIDAGHGGKDPGAIGKISKEKDITLAVALELGKKIHEELMIAGAKACLIKPVQTKALAKIALTFLNENKHYFNSSAIG